MRLREALHSDQKIEISLGPQVIKFFFLKLPTYLTLQSLKKDFFFPDMGTEYRGVS